MVIINIVEIEEKKKENERAYYNNRWRIWEIVTTFG